MNSIQKRALQYVKNTGGGATYENFVEDHAPIGVTLWEDLRSADTVGLNTDGKIIILPLGEKVLKEGV